MFNFLQEQSLRIVLVGTALIAAAFFALVIVPEGVSDTNPATGKIVGIIIESVGFLSSLIAFMAVVVASKEKWGELADFRTYVGVGTLIGALYSALQLSISFQLFSVPGTS